ncbi:hypothetical protein GCM10010302_58330 [Streptomyces polychromogenes]|uniref:Uncharacterized protein n=1 Tax=Streptomyces polychromogenes TaxID=67342 RepID=A0ABN0VMP4_9ACTN
MRPEGGEPQLGDGGPPVLPRRPGPGGGFATGITTGFATSLTTGFTTGFTTSLTSGFTVGFSG